MGFADPKRLVAEGYDRVGDVYACDAAVRRAAERAKYTQALFDCVPPGSRVVELGCGAGVPSTRLLADRYAVTGVDISEEQVRRARANVPGVAFVCADMVSLQLPANSVDAVVAFYSIIHVPRGEQGQLLRAAHGWLRPGGLFLGTFGAGDAPADVEPDWFGAPMYWSAFAPASTVALVGDSGLSVLSAEVETADEDGQPVSFLWVRAENPR